MPCMQEELQMALVYSTRAHARILKIDATHALSLPGVVAFFSAKDIEPERNKLGYFQDEMVFYSDKVKYSSLHHLEIKCVSLKNYKIPYFIIVKINNNNDDDDNNKKKEVKRYFFSFQSEVH